MTTPQNDSKDEQKAIVSMCGLDRAGKTTILQFIQSGEHTVPMRTIGASVQNLKIENLQLNVHDLGGQIAFRNIWPGYLSYSIIVIYVIDASARERFEESKRELEKVLRSLQKDAKLVILAHKQDIEGAATREELIEYFGLKRPIFPDNWRLIETSALTGKGLRELIVWLYESLTNKKLPSSEYTVPIECYENGDFVCILRILGECNKDKSECSICHTASCQNCDNCSPDCFM